jgi:hypothetical protein
MLRTLQTVFVCVALCALFGWALSSHAALIIVADLGDDAADDIELSSGILSTTDDGTAATTGDQNTAVEFVGFLDALAADINTPIASLSLDGFTPSGQATIFFGSTMVQDFSGGTLSLYDAANTLLLSANMYLSGLTGPSMAPGMGGLFTTYVDGLVTGGTLATHLDGYTIRMEMHLPLINGGAGFSTNPAPGLPTPTIHVGDLNSFAAGATIEISAEPSERVVPEPAAAVALAIGSALCAACLRRRRV